MGEEEILELKKRLVEAKGTAEPMSEMEYIGKVEAELKKIRDAGREPSKVEILQIKINVRTGEEEVPLEPSREQKIEARVAQLTETFTRRALEEIARNMELEPTKAEYPNKESLARAIAEKEIPQEEAEPA